MTPSLKLAIGEFRDHKTVYLAIILVISLCMCIFITQSALNEYNDYVTDKTIKTMYGDGVVVKAGTGLRNVISGAPDMERASEIANKINAISGFSAVLRAEGEGGAIHKELEAHNRSAGESDGGTFWGIDVENDESVCALKNKIVEGEYFNTSKTYTQAAMGSPAGLELMRFPAPFLSAGGYSYSLTWGRYDSGSVKAYPVLVGRSCATLHNLRVGEVFIATWLTTQGALYNDVYLEIIGIYETGKPLFESINYIVPIESMQEVKAWDSSTANYVCVKGPAGMSETDVASQIRDAAGGDGTFYTASDLKTIWEGNLGAMGKFILYVTIAASLLLAVAAVKYVMDSIIIRKQREIGTLKALGARDRTVASIFFYQALIIGIVSGALGLILSIVIMNAISYYGMSIPYVMGSSMEIKFMLSPIAVALALVLPVAVALAASVLPCLKVAKLSPIEAIRRGELHGAKAACGDLKRKMAMRRGVASSAAIALDEMRDHKAIYGTIVAVIAIALAVFLLQSAYEENFTQNLTGAVRDTLSSDGMILAEGANYRSIFGGAPVIENATRLAEEIENETGFSAIARSNSQSVVEFIDENGSMIFDGATFWGIDVNDDERVFDLKSKIIDGQYFSYEEDYGQNFIGEQAQQIPGVQFGGLGTMMVVQELEKPYPALVGLTAAKAHGLKVGDEFTFLITNSKKGSGIVSCQFYVIGIYDTKMPIVDALMYFTPRIAINEMMGYGEYDGNAILVKAPGDPDYRQVYGAMASAEPEMEAFSWHEAVLFFSGASFDALTLIIYTAIAITLALVAISIKYAMDSTVDRKTREIGMLKAVGARDRMVVMIFIWQGAFIGTASGLLAIAASYAAMYASVNIFQIQSQLPLGMLLDVSFTTTAPMIAATLFAPIAVSLAASYMPSKRAAKLSPVEALRKGELNM